MISWLLRASMTGSKSTRGAVKVGGLVDGPATRASESFSSRLVRRPHERREGIRSHQSIIRQWWRFRAKRLISKQCADTCPLWSASLHSDFFHLKMPFRSALWCARRCSDALLGRLWPRRLFPFFKSELTFKRSRWRKSVRLDDTIMERLHLGTSSNFFSPLSLTHLPSLQIFGSSEHSVTQSAFAMDSGVFYTSLTPYWLRRNSHKFSCASFNEMPVYSSSIA